MYAKLKGDTSNDEYNALSSEEKTQWSELFNIAINRNIAFGTV